MKQDGQERDNDDTAPETSEALRRPAQNEPSPTTVARLRMVMADNLQVHDCPRSHNPPAFHSAATGRRERSWVHGLTAPLLVIDPPAARSPDLRRAPDSRGVTENGRVPRHDPPWLTLRCRSAMTSTAGSSVPLPPPATRSTCTRFRRRFPVHRPRAARCGRRGRFRRAYAGGRFDVHCIVAYLPHRSGDPTAVVVRDAAAHDDSVRDDVPSPGRRDSGGARWLPRQWLVRRPRVGV